MTWCQMGFDFMVAGGLVFVIGLIMMCVGAA